MRKNLFEQLNPLIANDFEIPQRVASKGFLVCYEPQAIAKEPVSKDSRIQFQRKTRIIARGFEGTWYLISLFTPFRLMEFLSHKFLRWFAWIFLISSLISSYFLPQKMLFYFQIIFYCLALLGSVLKTKIFIFYLPYYFVIVNLAAIVGFVKFITRSQKATWEQPKENDL